MKRITRNRETKRQREKERKKQKEKEREFQTTLRDIEKVSELQ